MNLEELIAKAKAVYADMESALAKSKSAETDEKKKEWRSVYNAKSQEFDELKSDIEDAKAQAHAKSLIDSAEKELKTDTKGKSLNPEDPPEGKSIEVVNDPVKNERERRKFFLEYVKGGAKALQGEQFRAIQPKDSKVRDVAPDAVVLPWGMRNEILGGKVVLSTDATGGATDSGAANLLAEDFKAQLLKEPVISPALFDNARVIRAINGKAVYPMLENSTGGGIHGGVAFTWKGTEGADKQETEPVFKEFTVSTVELSGWTELSLQALSRSAIELESELMTLFRDAARHEFSLKMLNGDGSDEPQGVVAASGVKTVARGTADQVDWDDLVNLEYAVTMGNRVGARYTVNDDAEKFIKGQTDGDGKPLFTRDTGSNISNLLAGYSYNGHEYGPALGTKGDVTFGNWNNYAFAVEEEIAIAKSEHAEFKKGRIVFRLIAFVGGKPIFPTGFAVLDDPA